MRSPRLPLSSDGVIERDDGNAPIDRFVEHRIKPGGRRRIDDDCIRPGKNDLANLRNLLAHVIAGTIRMRPSFARDKIDAISGTGR
jgi:hypothetical protein